MTAALLDTPALELDQDYQWQADNDRADRILEAIGAGLITEENFSYDDRVFLRHFYMGMPLLGWERGEDGKLHYGNVGTVDLMEGREWCFLTNRDGKFTLVSLHDALRADMLGGVLHLWHDELGPDGTWREDFDADTALGVYQEEAQNAALYRGVTA